ncbi:hypothetical protein Q5752_002508 [Cryptotrichosporon argae]
MVRKDEVANAGAGTLFVYGETQPPALDAAWDVLPATAPVLAPSPDLLLHCGIADYTFVPQSAGGVLGRGKFSTVYKVTGADGQHYALKHTALYPHHPLISARLLREPTLLAQLPPHPCLIGVDAWVRTDGHFYLVEQFAASHVPLPAHPLPLAPSRAAYILDQLVSVVRDGLHEGGRVCHRDLKGENVLVDVEMGEILLLDLGLATHYSASEPKLTTCCGSPAFHSPEIVYALSKPPGEVTYYGPELDIWCIALTMLSLLTQTRFPLGPTHTSRYIMSERARDRLQELDELYPPEAPWRALGPGARRLEADEHEAEADEWDRVRRALRAFLDVDARRRMASFEAYDVGPRMRARVDAHRAKQRANEFKSTSFVKTDVKYTLPLTLEPATPPLGDDTPAPLVLRNLAGDSERRVLSYIKYLLRSNGILYHHIPDSSPPILQLVLPIAPPLPSTPDTLPPLTENGQASHGAAATAAPSPTLGWVSNLLSLSRKPRSASVPPKQGGRGASSPAPPPHKGKKEWAQACWMRVETEGRRHSGRAHSHADAPSRPGSRAPSRASSRARQASGDSAVFAPAHDRAPPAPPAIVVADTLTPLAPLAPMTSRPPVARVASARKDVYLSPLSRQLSLAATSDSPESSSDSASVSASASASAPPSRSMSRRSTSASVKSAASGSVSGSGSGSTSHRRPSCAPRAPRVIITLSEPRGYDIVRSALDVRHAESPLATSSTRSMPVSVPTSSEDDEPERGRPRSKDEPGSVAERSVTVKPAKGKAGEAGVGVAPGKAGRKGQDERSLLGVRLAPREASRGRRSGIWESLFGKSDNGLEPSAAGSAAASMQRRSSSVPAA